MSRHWRVIGVMLSAMMLWPTLAGADIVQRLVFTAIASERDSEGADVLTVAETTGCGGNQLRMMQGVLENQEEYATLRPELIKRIRDGTPMVVTLLGCPPEKDGEKAVPLVRLITGCGPNSCADGRARLYLDEQLKPQVKRRSPHVLLLPLPAAALPGTWKVEIRDTVRPDLVRVSGLSNAADFFSGNLVGEYRSFDLDGNLDTKAELDGQGRQNGPKTSYYPNGTLRSLGHWHDDLPVGEHYVYRPNGKVSTRQIYDDGGLLLHSQQLSEQGVVTHEEAHLPGMCADTAAAACKP